MSAGAPGRSGRLGHTQRPGTRVRHVARRRRPACVDRGGRGVTADQVLVTVGAVEAMFLLAQDRTGGRVALVSPCFPPAEVIPTGLGSPVDVVQSPVRRRLPPADRRDRAGADDRHPTRVARVAAEPFRRTVHRSGDPASRGDCREAVTRCRRVRRRDIPRVNVRRRGRTDLDGDAVTARRHLLLAVQGARRAGTAPRLADHDRSKALRAPPQREVPDHDRLLDARRNVGRRGIPPERDDSRAAGGPARSGTHRVTDLGGGPAGRRRTPRRRRRVLRAT